MAAKKIATKVTDTKAAVTVTKASPLADRVSQAMQYIRMAITILAVTGPTLSALDRKRMAKLKKGGDKFIPLIAQIAQTWAVQIRAQPTATMTSAMQTATLLQPLVTLLAGFLQEVQDTGAVAAGTSWSTATALYSVLKRMSRKDPTLQKQLAPVAEFFAFRHPVDAIAETPVTKSTKTSRRKERVLANAQKTVAAASGTQAPAGPAPVATPAGATGPATASH